MTTIRILGAATLVVMVGLFGAMVRRERKRGKQGALPAISPASAATDASRNV